MNTLPPQCSMPAVKKSRKTILWLLIAFALCAGLAFAFWALFVGLPWLAQRIADSGESRAPLHGVAVVLQAENGGGSAPAEEDLQRAVKILDRRARSLGLKEGEFAIRGPGEITARLPKEAGVGDGLKVLLVVGQVEFVDVGHANLSAGSVIVTDLDRNATAPVNASSPELSKVYHTLLTGDQVSTASLTIVSQGNYGVSIAFNQEGKQILADYTRSHIGETLAILLDKRILSTPRIQSEISDGMAVIEGAFDREVANQLVMVLSYKALPFRVKVVRQSEY